MAINKTYMGQHISITGTLVLKNELILGNIHIDSSEEPGMIKWDGTNFKGYTGSVWTDLDNIGITDHGMLGGLINDDHTIYSLADGSRNFSAVVSYTSHPTFNADTQLADKKYVDDNKIGHIILNDNTGVTARDNLDFIGFTFSDDDAPNSTIITHNLGDESNVSTSGVSPGDVLQRNTTDDGYDFIQSNVYDEILRISEAVINTNDQLSIFVPAGYKIDAIVLRETSGNDAGDISLGIAIGTDEIISIETINANTDILAPLGQEYFSSVNDTDLYISSSSWGSGVITIYVTIKKII